MQDFTGEVTFFHGALHMDAPVLPDLQEVIYFHQLYADTLKDMFDDRN